MSARRASRRAIAAISVLSACLIAALALTGPAGAEPTSAETAGDGQRFRVLVFSRTTEFRHYAIPLGIDAIRSLGEEHGFGVEATEDPAAFRRKSLRRFDAVIFLLTTGTVLDRPQKRAFRRYIRAGGGYVGIHSAADTEHDWPFYGKLVGAHFKSHPIQQPGWFDNGAPRHPATAHLDERFLVLDEFYSFKRNPRPDVRVLLTIDESTYWPDPNTSHLPGGDPASGRMGDHPMSWCHSRLGGRAFYTALGHEGHLYLLDWYRRHLLGGILTAARQVRANCSPPAPVARAGAGPPDPRPGSG